MATAHDMVDLDRSRQHVKEALDVLTATLGEVRGCEYPRLIAREIQALIVACVAHEKAKRGAMNGGEAEASAAPPVVVPAPSSDTVQLLALIEAREAEIARLRDLLHHGVETIEAHTLTTSDGTAVMLHGDYQCISAAAIEQWVRRAEAALHSEKPALRHK